MNNIELLSPVGDFNCLKAAVQNGADCVYFGAELFNARNSATNFNDEELKQAIQYAKLRNVKTNLTLNILIKNNEFDDAINLAIKAYEYGIDAIIVQDLGLSKKLIELLPNLPIHASTQMTIHNLEGALEAEKLGFKRVVLSRELSLNEIKYICDNSNIEIEVFIHGALCISYSGQCLLSSMIGARSGNRGKCAQPCRLPYELIEENFSNNETTLDKGYLLSTRDLCSLNLLPTLVNLGIKCFKIEGRLKNPEYVATVTRIYRKYIDLALSNKPYKIDKEDEKALLQVFNRGSFSTGYLDTKPNNNLIFKHKPNNMGIYLGKVTNYNANKGYISLKLEENIAIGDTISLEKEKGTYTVSELIEKNNNIPSAKPETIVKIGRVKGNIHIGDKIFKMSSKNLNTNIMEFLNNENIKTGINCEINIHKNTPISMRIYTNNCNNINYIYNNIDFTINSELIPIDSINSPITTNRIIAQIDKINNTPFYFKNIKVNLDDGLYVPSISKLNELRRNCIQNLENILINRITRKFDNTNLINTLESSNLNTNKENTTKKISILLNKLNDNFNYSNLENINNVYIPLKYFYTTEQKYIEIINTITKKFKTYIYLPSILKNTDIIKNNIENILKSFNITGFVISNISHIYLLNNYLKNYDFIANYNMNIYNNTTISELQKLGITYFTISPELDKENINSICSNINNTETIVYGKLPVMTTNYCVISKSNSCLKNCANNCTNNNKTYYLKDRMNAKFRLIPDNFSGTATIYNSKISSIPPNLIHSNYIRFDFIDESIEEINSIITSFIHNEILEGKEYTNGNLNRIV